MHLHSTNLRRLGRNIRQVRKRSGSGLGRLEGYTAAHVLAAIAASEENEGRDGVREAVRVFLDEDEGDRRRRASFAAVWGTSTAYL